MEQNKQLIVNNKDSLITQKQSLTLSEKTELCIAKYGTPQEFASTFTPDKIPLYASNPLRCIIGTAPSLYTIGKTYGDKYAVQWLATQFVALSEFCGMKNKITTYQLESLSRKFMTRHSDLKVSEIMLFVDKVASGDFGRIAWSTFDPVAVLEKVAAFRIYCNDIEQEHLNRIEEEKYAEHVKKCIPMPEHVKKHLNELANKFTSPYKKNKDNA